MPLIRQFEDWMTRELRSHTPGALRPGRPHLRPGISIMITISDRIRDWMEIHRRGFAASIWWQLTARRLRPALASVGIGIPLRSPIVALGLVGVGPQMLEEVFPHFVDDAISDLALTAPTPTAKEQRSVACATCPDQRLILHVKQLDAPFVLVRDAEDCLIPLTVAFYKGPVKDVFRHFLFRYDDDRQFLFHDLCRNKRMKLALHRRDENLGAGDRVFFRFVLGDGLGECEGEKRQDSKHTVSHG